jgi:hypothetical protein
VDVIGDLLAGVALDAVDRLPIRCRARRRKQLTLLEDDALRPGGTGEHTGGHIAGSLRGAGTAQGEQEVGRAPISRVRQATLTSADGGPGVQGSQRHFVEWDGAFGVELAERHFEPAAMSGKVPEAVQFEVECDSGIKTIARLTSKSRFDHRSS